MLPRTANTAGRQGLVLPLVDILVVLSDPQTWEPAVGHHAARMAAEVRPRGIGVLPLVLFPCPLFCRKNCPSTRGHVLGALTPSVSAALELVRTVQLVKPVQLVWLVQTCTA